MSLLSAMTGYPWMITQQAHETIASIVNRTNDIEAVRASVGKPMQNSRSTEVRNGVAIIPVTGPIFRYANVFTELSGATSTQMLSLDFNNAMKDTEIKAVLLDIDSPGGHANGLVELMNMIASARGVKPIKAYVGGQGASAAYGIASAADEIIVSESAIVGSIGTMMEFEDRSEAEIRDGIKRVRIVSKVSPNKNRDPSTEEGLGDLQKMADTLGEVFVAAIARNRGVSVDHVLENYGKGGVFVGAESVTAGLADRLGSFEGVLAELSAGNTGRGGGTSARQRQLNILKMEE